MTQGLYSTSGSILPMLVQMNGSDTDTDRSLSYDIISAIADHEGVDITEIEPPEYESLYSIFNPEALDDLFAPCEYGTPRPGGTIEFTYGRYTVVATSDGNVSITDQSP